MSNNNPPQVQHARWQIVAVTQDVQNARPARPQAKEAPEAYPLGYVEDASEPRTKLADFFNILLTAGHSSHDQKRLGPRCNCIGQRGIR